MTDPAISAARRVPASAQIAGDETWAIAAAREALKPLRARHKPARSLLWPDTSVCAGCYDHWPCPDAELIYPEDELP